jgi:hypothetical protein
MKNYVLISILCMLAALGSSPLFAEEDAPVAAEPAGLTAAELTEAEQADAAEPVIGPGKNRVLDRLSLLRGYFGFSLLESGSWENGGTMSNRANAVLSAPAGFSLRVQALDKRPAPPANGWLDGVTNWNYGLYQKETNSRILYGQLEISGLAARTRNIWSHSAPFVEAHKRTSADMKTSPQSNRKNSFFCALGSPVLKILDDTSWIPLNFAIKSDASIFADDKGDLFYQFGSDFYWGLQKKLNNTLHFEWVMTEKTLAERGQSTWFSEKPYLPGRKLTFNAFNLTFSNPYFGLSSDLAYSDVFAWGQDVYINGAVRIGSAPWRFSFSGDGAGKKYTASDGSVNGAGFRLAGKFEWFAPGGGTGLAALIFGTGAEFTAQTMIRSNGIGEAFVMSASKISYRFPVIRGHFITPSRLSFSFDRDAANPYGIRDTTTILAGVKTGPAQTVLRLTFAELSASEPGKPVRCYPSPGGEKQREFIQTDVEITAPVYFLTLKGTLSARTEKNKQKIEETVLGGSFSASIQGKPGRLTLKISSKNKDAPLEYYLSWRIEKKW